MTNGNQVAITGMGIISCIGCDLKTVSESLQQGRSGIILDEIRVKKGFRSALTGKIADFFPTKWNISKKLQRSMCEPALYAYAAAQDAIRHSGIDSSEIRSERCGIIIGNDSTAKPVIESIETLHHYHETHFIGGGNIFRTMNSTATMNLAAFLGVQGANWTLSAACASGAHSIGQASMLIQLGLQDTMIAGGTQETHWTSMLSFDALGAFSTRHDHPQHAARPFDKDRDGLVPSGGCACLVLENLDKARKRGAAIYGIIRGYGFSSDGGGHLSMPTGDGSVRAMKSALKNASLNATDIDYINAHATSTPGGDLSEAKSIAEVFGTKIPVSSTKSMTGHECWMSGASEVLYTTLMAAGKFIAPNINFNAFDDQTPKIDIVRETRPTSIRTALSNSFGFGGTNASIVLEFNI